MINTFILLTLILFYITFILYFYYYIFYLQKKTNKSNPELNYIPLIKDKEYIFFKDSLFNFYYSTIFILFIFIYKHNYFNLLLDLNVYFICFLFTIFIIYSILLSSFFNVKLFSLYKEIKNFINLLNNFNFIPLENSNNNFGFNGKKNTYSNKRNFSTYSLSECKENFDSIPIDKAKELKEFHSNYNVFAGYYGYTNIFHLGNYTDFDDLDYNSIIL